MIHIPEDQSECVEFRVRWQPHDHFWYGLVVGFIAATILFTVFITVIL